jgi:hypothetical protein
MYEKMVLAVTLLTLTSNLAYSETRLMKAPNDHLMSLLRFCKYKVILDKLSESNMNKHLLACINEKLEESDYQLINTLPRLNPK